MRYYEINEDMAKVAHDMMSFRDYKTGSRTAEYRAEVDRAYKIADEAVKYRPEMQEKIYGLADRYAKKLADNYNKRSRIGTMCPSVMISGGSNFPTRKKERQNNAYDNAMKEYQEIQKILEKIESIERGKDIIKSGDSNAIEQLEKKVAQMTAYQEMMKKVNAYYRKHKTLDGCPELTPDEIESLKAEMQSSWHYESKPYQTFALSNNRQNLRRYEHRLKQLKEAKEAGRSEDDMEFFKVVENTEIMRLQLIFDGKPDADVRSVLKSNGFRWSPKNSAWQRHLNTNGRYAMERVVKELRVMEG